MHLLRFSVTISATRKIIILGGHTMAKIVRYNGGTQRYSGCTEPNALIVGKEYEVIAAKDTGWQTNYILKGIAGDFNSVWFDEVASTASTFMAIAHCIPTVGKRCECSKLEFVNGKLTLVCWSTSPVKKIQDMGNNIYHVTTHNSLYIVQVG